MITTARQLQFVRVDIQWVVQPGKERGSQDTRFNAGLVAKSCAITSWADDTPEQVSTPEVTNLLVLPSVTDKAGKETVPPMVVTTRARTTSPGTFPAAQTIINRWEAREQNHKLQSAVRQLGNRRNSTASEPASSMSLNPLEPILIDKCVIGLQSAQFGKAVILTFSDGSVQHRDRSTFEEIYTEREYASVMNLQQVGFTFPDDWQCQQIALSPTGCSMIQLGDSGKMRWSRIRLPDGDIGNGMRDERYAATIAGLTVTAATSIKYQTNFDDILAIVRPLAEKPRFVQDWVSEVIRILAVQVDYVVEPSHDALLKNTQLPSCMAILVSLGFRGDTRPRTFQSAFASMTAAIRSAAFNATVVATAQFNVGGRRSPMDDHEVVEMLGSLIRWSLDLVAWITDSLFELMNDEEFSRLLTPERAAELGPYLEKRNDVALHLLICSSSRCFLSALCRRLMHIETIAAKAVTFYRKQSALATANTGTPNPRMQRAFQNLQQVSSSALVRAGEFEKLVSTLGSGVNHAYGTFLPKMARGARGAGAGAGATPQPQSKEEEETVKMIRAQMETQTLVATSPPLGLFPVLRKFFGYDLVMFRKATDPARLFFQPLSVMTVQDDGSVVDGMRTAQLDTFTKNKLKMGPGKQWRRCTRCTWVMEEMPGKGPGLTFMMAQQRRCPCNGTLAVLPPGKLDFTA
ncbi:hypothetical protein GMORB2_6121 [Geosmithia morbida]|uniref:Mediator of RNA polymerase II transcription subunit 16 n=1 Tax=Geosmithia morbida TaxID=1094350 RepID=A0A9P4YV68_9HYPO|nr:uncharacterized protein GMORB2_6121 [Geosmithia morbida]KAF4123420.1 hypothetical protein GMORB2_6121 [Geosmithia morbida]